MRRILIAAALLAVACSNTLSESEIRQAATSFASNRVSYFTKEGNNTDTVAIPDVEIIDMQHKEEVWEVILKISAVIDGAEKKQHIKMIIDDKNGELKRFGTIELP